MEMRRILWNRVFTGLLIGCISRFCYQTLQSKLISVPEKALKTKECQPCEDPLKERKDPCPFCGPKTVVADIGNRITAPYKPKGMYEITRWLYFDEKNMYDIIEGAPVAKLVGGTYEETRAVTQVALEYVNVNNVLGKTWELVSLQNGYMRTDVFRGTDYILDINVKSKEKYASEVLKATLRVKMVHPFEPDKESLSLVSQKKMPAVGIHIIALVSANEETLVSFVKRYTEIRSNNDQLTLVLFQGKGLFGEESATLAPKVVELIRMYPSNGIDFIEVEGDYEYLNGVHQGSKRVGDRIVLTLTLDMYYGSDFLQACRLLAVPNRRVYFPTAFSQFDPDIIESGMPTGKPKNIDKMDINKFTGYWMINNYDFICAYKSDLLSALDKFSLSTQQGTDVDVDIGKNLYDLFLSKNLDVISSVEPDLRRLFRKVRCNPRFMPDEEYRQCFRTSAEKLGSKPAMSMVYLTEIAMRKL